ncbi:IS66 family insertion sequence element accessory protein TnpB [Sulfurimonas sp. MAG313]|nr:IS66 family insertion sequence element accessory protein TnpB [Sulfurimonas sp. MAG313]MDF1881050.1 IS66 family insertion sequence element accessory protein TnpB [Sulfurimonas sp. MAG313]
MLGLGTEHTYYFYLSVVDMRKGFNGLSGLVYYHMEEVKGYKVVYAFINKRKDKLKLLHWTSSGFVLYYKRLEKGVFELPKYDIEEGLIVLSYTEMIMLLEGISIVNIKKNERYLSTK